MAREYIRMRSGSTTDTTVRVDEPCDILEQGPTGDQRRRHAAEIIKRMDASHKWQRLIEPEWTDVVIGPDGATTSDGTPFADAITKAIEEGARSVEIVTTPEGTQVIPSRPPAAHMSRVEKADVEASGLPPTQADVRAWAVAQGLEVNSLGAVPKKLIQQYIEAHRG